jgi:hypothetical protein
VGASADGERIELTVFRDGSSLRGCARDLSGETREFIGWLGLLSVLERLLAGPETAPTTEEP